MKLRLIIAALALVAIVACAKKEEMPAEETTAPAQEMPMDTAKTDTAAKM
jgi:hypothetical protein